MKYIFASDIHGSAFWCEKLVEAFKKEKADRLVLLGDELYHGPRNPLPDGYDPKAVYEMLNALSDKIIAVRGNCDSEVDQMVLDFPMMTDYALLELDGKSIYLTHGHLPVSGKSDIVISGHTHITKCEEEDGVLYLNPGSVSMPKDKSGCGYILYEKGIFVRKELKA